MEFLMLTRVVAERLPQHNFQFPAEISDLAKSLGGMFDRKEKWMFAAAGLLLLRDRSDAELRRLVGFVGSAKIEEELAALVELARKGEFTKKALKREDGYEVGVGDEIGHPNGNQKPAVPQGSKRPRQRRRPAAQK